MMRLMSRIHTRYPVQRHRGCSRDTCYETRYSTVIVEPVFGCVRGALGPQRIDRRTRRRGQEKGA